MKNRPYIVSLNFVPENYKEDAVFLTNMKRASTLKYCKSQIYVTSNLEVRPSDAKVLNYSSYLNNSVLYDNIALMFFKLLIKIGVKKVYIAGLDGYSKTPSDNYVSSELVNQFSVFEEKNEIMSKQFDLFGKSLEIVSLTESMYIKNF